MTKLTKKKLGVLSGEKNSKWACLVKKKIIKINDEKNGGLKNGV